MTNELTHFDLFSGIGGFALAAQRAGFRTVGFSEIEPYACKVLAARFPGVTNFGDVRRIDFSGIGRVTVLTGGFPCQPWSEAGKRRGASDDRHLWPAMCNVIESIRPTWVIGENVSGFISLGLDGSLSDLARIGYSSQPFVVPACAVGADHLRERVWIIAYADGERKSQPNGNIAQSRRRVTNSPEPLTPDALCAGLQGSGEHRISTIETKEVRPPPATSCFPRREAYPDLLRNVHGVSARPHRIKGLGNAIVPQVVEPFFHWIRQIEQGEIT